MKNRGGGDAVSQSKDMDSENLFDVLNDNSWLTVLEFLWEDPRDILNVCAASSKFENIIENHKLREMESGKNVCRLQEVLPLILKGLVIKDVYNLRMTCKRTKLVVDRILEENIRISPYESLDLFPRLMTHLKLDSPRRMSYEWRNFKLPFLQEDDTEFVVDDIRKLEDFEMHLTESVSEIGGNPVPAKFVCFALPETIEFWEPTMLNTREYSEEKENLDKERNEFIERAMQLFGKFPRRFRYVEIFANVSPSYNENYELFRKTVELLPDLHQIEMSYGESPFNEFQAERSEIALSPLPPAGKLERIKIGYFKVPECFLGQVSGVYGDELKGLELLEVVDDAKFNGKSPDKTDDMKPTAADARQVYEFPVLLELNLGLHFQPVGFLTSVLAPGLMSLKLGFYEAKYVPPLDDMARILVHFPSIKYLRLSDYNITSFKNLDGGILNHQNIKLLELRDRFLGTSSKLSLLRFFAGFCPNLESVNVNGGISGEDKTLNVVDYDLVMLGRFHESTVWREAPNLKIVKFMDFGTFTRLNIGFHQIK